MNRLLKAYNSINLVYAQEEFPKTITKSIFLAGPTTREDGITQWRKEAIQLLQNMNYDGTVFIPEIRDGIFNNKYNDQVEWEQKCLDACDCILFWIDREYSEGLTTNIEWGKYQHSEKIAVGFPKESKHNKYIEYECNNFQIPIHNNLNELIKFAVDFIGDGAKRTDGECYVPLNIWNTSMFQNWYKSQRDTGNELQFARVNYVFKMPKAKKIFLWILYVKVYIKEEDRVKENEFVVSRTDISSVVIYKKDYNDILNSDIILIKEFRSPVCNDESMVYEIPGGSSITDKDAFETIISEINEETGLSFDSNRLIFENSRQLMATLSSHKCYLYSIEINEDELTEIKKKENSVNGVEEDTERTYLKIMKMEDILENNLLDWSNIGHILSVLNKRS